LSDIELKENKNLLGIYTVTDLNTGTSKLATQNLTPGSRVYGEELQKIAGIEFRLWDPYRSKLAASILRGMPPACIPIRPGSVVLYLGAGSGTTPSHVSDIVGPKGLVFCVEFSPRAARDLVANCHVRSNMIPIFDDARKPENYSHLVPLADAIYCDVAQPEQAKLLNTNAAWFLKKDGQVMLAIKARSIDVTMEPAQVYDQEIKKLTPYFQICDRRNLRPYHKDHVIVAAKASDPFD
jgi:fibrillarin-like pre-rRNA processing protein